LRRRHSRRPVTSGDFTTRGHLGITAHTNPQDGQGAEGVPPSLLRGGSADEVVVDDDPGTCPSHRRDPRHPRRLDSPEFRPDDHRAVRRELDPVGGRPQRQRQSFDERVDAHHQPWIRQDRLQAPGDRGFS
jgi:hypothetical protein